MPELLLESEVELFGSRAFRFTRLRIFFGLNGLDRAQIGLNQEATRLWDMYCCMRKHCKLRTKQVIYFTVLYGPKGFGGRPIVLTTYNQAATAHILQPARQCTSW